MDRRTQYRQQIDSIWRQRPQLLQDLGTFPVMTDPSLAEFFGTSPCLGVEALHYDGQKLTDGDDIYLHERNSPWLKYVNWHMPPLSHVVVYAEPVRWLDHELGRIRERCLKPGTDQYIAYVVSGPYAKEISGFSTSFRIFADQYFSVKKKA